ncbi:hypothetical protein [Anaeromyxobacter sp. PSR-1]|nr:hypothetical protein [Anaeromyxobacter sp. PSR-1]GAO01697.1 hypothetical protein PSR1_00555 [Anaeromyxobacter sp. PSR-1]
MTRTVLRAALLALAALVALWAFVSHLQPAFSGERMAALLRCN